MTLKVTGAKELEKQFDRIKRGINQLQGENQVSFDVLFDSAFMRRYSSFESFDEFLDHGGFEVNSPEDFEAIPDDVFDTHTNSCTNFSSWSDMLGSAVENYVAKSLGF